MRRRKEGAQYTAADIAHQAGSTGAPWELAARGGRGDMHVSTVWLPLWRGASAHMPTNRGRPNSNPTRRRGRGELCLPFKTPSKNKSEDSLPRARVAVARCVRWRRSAVSRARLQAGAPSPLATTSPRDGARLLQTDLKVDEAGMVRRFRDLEVLLLPNQFAQLRESVVPGVERCVRLADE